MDQQIFGKIDTFFKNYKHQTYKKGEILIRADETPRSIYYITQGHVKQYALSQKGDELVVNIFRPVAFFPMSFAMNNTKNLYFFEAMTDVEVWKAPQEEVIAFIKKEPDILYDLMSRVYKGMDGLLVRMTHLMAGNAYARLVTELIIQAKRFGRENNKLIAITISEKDLAASSGMTRETVSREMKHLKDKGLVTLAKNILTITNITLLEAELSSF